MTSIGPAGERGRYLVELTPPETGWHDIQALASRFRLASGESAVRFLRSLFVPEDGQVYLLFEGPSRSAVRKAASRAGLGVEGVVETLRVDATADAARPSRPEARGADP